MKYWFYSEGNILGPYAPAELLSLPAFGHGSLVCAEAAGGDNPGDWRPAEEVGEIAEALSVGVGAVNAGAYSAAGASIAPSGPEEAYYRAKNAPGEGYGELLDTIDNILGAYKEAEIPAEEKLPPDFDLMQNFDIRLSKIQEELEAARWEKNLLLEKIRSRELEDHRNKERISELEEQLKAALQKSEKQEEKLSAARAEAERLSASRAVTKGQAEPGDEERRPSPARKITPFAAKPAPAPGPAAESPRSPVPDGLKKLRPIGESRREEGSDAKENERPSIKPLWGADRKPSGDAGVARPVPAEDHGQPARAQYPEKEAAAVPVPEVQAAAQRPPAAAQPAVPPVSAPQTLPPAAAYDFSSIAQPPQPVSAAPGRAEAVPGTQVPPAQPRIPAAAPEIPVIMPSSAQAPSGWNTFPASAPDGGAKAPVQNVWGGAATIPVHQAADGAIPSAQPSVGVPGGEAHQGRQTERITIALQEPLKDGSRQKEQRPSAEKSKNTVFIVTLLAFGCAAVFGLGIFFFGGGSLSEFSMINFGAAKDKEPAAQEKSEEPQTAAPESAAAPAAQENAFDSAAENTRKAIEIVKGYKLSGGRGAVSAWFANSFLSSSASGSNEEWSATILHGDTLVVQYKLLRTRQEPLVYQFEVDAAKGDILRGLNNNAIELLESGSQPEPAPAPKPKARKKAKVKKNPDLLPLPEPEPEAARSRESAPTGFETADLGTSEKVKYIVAQESDEELF
ncbi:MAG TPA: hypothetical protein PL037_01215 [Elusimicrobiales bacterium]|nr:hypothetical protein [Elusimicrobiales bacterium]